MSTTSARVEIPAERWKVRKSAVLVALIVTLMAGALGVYALTRPTQVPTAATVEVDSPARPDIPGGLRVP